MDTTMDTGQDWPHDEPELSYQSSSDEASSSEASQSSMSSQTTMDDAQNAAMDIVDLTVETSLASRLKDSCEPIYGADRDSPLNDAQSESWLRRNQREGGSRDLKEAVVDSIVYRPSMTVEILDGSFLKIERLAEIEDNQIVMYGRWMLLACDKRLEAYIPRVRGELVWIGHERRPVYLDQVKCIRKIRFTNKRRRAWESHEHLVCRLKLTDRTGEYSSGPNEPRDREPLGAAEVLIEYLCPDEADPELTTPNRNLREQWRGESVPFGAGRLPPGVFLETLDRPAVIDLETPPPTIDLTRMEDDGEDEDTPIDLRSYTFGDAFCGGGGVSCGARQAGMSIKWAFDRCHHAMGTYRMNFDAPIMENSEVFEFMTNSPSDLLVDVAHCSPPCQPFSPAHTVHNQTRDETNSSCIFTATDLLKKARPRILTMEETYGLAQRHKPIFQRMIMDLVEIGYSVRWAVLECVNYGVPQYRKRLIILAAGPGETVPQLPEPTHGLPGGGLLPWNSIHSAIDNIPDGTPDHDVTPGIERWQLRGTREPYNGYQPARTVTCNGGEFNYHPSGARTFTCREFACLQTFPMEYRFSKQQVRRQIGNAVPPLFAKAIYREVHKSLRETDKQEMRESRRYTGIGM
ncbi:hypothetical protein N7492_003368 [Penicillium capsulatum]|uniref:DNA (cytosine-5-)-methyltransferase n=1 Tax=Penicillium capsulatum TaxID=69766 RepID=A0A9W9LW58_9EURO|nr:hypothetical protein N7492_003368 [Penicillium capsulatum]KAJ6122048.1 hypothetical protein N7512_004513 [Penicillium capsulatum]